MSENYGGNFHEQNQKCKEKGNAWQDDKAQQADSALRDCKDQPQGGAEPRAARMAQPEAQDALAEAPQAELNR